MTDAETLATETPYAQFICGPDAAAGHVCACCESSEECCCIAELDADDCVGCTNCGEPMIAIDFATGEAATDEQIEMLMADLREREARLAREEMT